MVGVSARRHFEGKIVGFRTKTEPSITNYTVVVRLIKNKIFSSSRLKCQSVQPKNDAQREGQMLVCWPR